MSKSKKPKIDCGHAYTMITEAKRLVEQSYPGAADWTFTESDNPVAVSAYNVHGLFVTELTYNPTYVLEMSLDELVDGMMQFAHMAFIDPIPLVCRLPLNEDVRH